MNWDNELEQLFSATVSQSTLEEAVELMVAISSSDDSYHRLLITVFDCGIKSCEEGNDKVIKLINKSGYQVKSIEAALGLLQDFYAIYLSEYELNKASHS